MCRICDFQLKALAEPAFLAHIARGENRDAAVIAAVSTLLLKLNDRERAELDPYVVSGLYARLRSLMPEAPESTSPGMRAVHHGSPVKAMPVEDAG